MTKGHKVREGRKFTIPSIEVQSGAVSWQKIMTELVRFGAVWVKLATRLVRNQKLLQTADYTPLWLLY